MSTIDNFIHAENLCTGSQGDNLANCIIENLRFLPYLDDKAESLVKDTGFVRAAPLQYLSGNTFVDLKPIGVANATVRMLQENDYGVVSFRCLQTFGRPMLALPSLQDLGLPSQEINITESLVIDNDATDVDGIPLRDISDCGTDNWCKVNVYLFNSRNLILAYSTEFSTLISSLEAIKRLINDSGDYYSLPTLAGVVNTKCTTASTAKAAALAELDAGISFVTGLASDWHRDYALQTLTNARALVNASYDFTSLCSELSTNVTSPLISNINDNTDFTTFDFNITTSAANYIGDLDYDLSEKKVFIAQQFISDWGTPASYDPTVSLDKQMLIRRVAVNYSYEIINITSYIMNKILSLYSMSNESQISDDIAKYKAYLALYVTYKAHFYDSITTQFTDVSQEGAPDSLASEFETAVTTLHSLVTTFTTQNVETAILEAVDNEAGEAIVDAFLDSIGTQQRIDIASLKTEIEDALNLYTGNESLIDNPNISPSSVSASGEVTTLNLGYDYTDKSKYYFADLAYAVGFGRLTNISSIQIDDEIYTSEDLFDNAGNPVTGISESGCTKFSFTRHVMPTYDPVVEMYIYPGLPDQPYCPTVNSYNNFAVNKYSGMFTKLLPADVQNEEYSIIGLFIYTGYRPMESTVENIYQVGTVDMNAINLNDPTLDDNSYESMLQRQVTSLVNSSSLIRDGVITTDDLKFYFHSEPIGTPSLTPDNYHYLDIPDAMTLPNMAIVEFKNFPLGESLKAPKITIRFTADDPYPKA